MYAHIAPGYTALHGTEQERKLRLLLSHAALEPGLRVLDVGCATAHLAPFFSAQEYLGVDSCPELLAYAPDGVQVRQARGEELPFPDVSWDVVLSLTALHNYADWRTGVRELFRVSRGQVLVGVLRRAAEHDAIVAAVRAQGIVMWHGLDLHDTLLVCRTIRF